MRGSAFIQRMSARTAHEVQLIVLRGVVAGVPGTLWRGTHDDRQTRYCAIDGRRLISTRKPFPSCTG